jgi:hypothetical protein
LGYRYVFLPVVFKLVFSVCALAQGQEAEGTRQLYYLGPEAAAKTAQPPTTTPKAAASLHLGLRYNVVLLHDQGKPEEIAANRVLKEGDCFAIDLQTNHSGNLYVLARQSSGAWLPLFPSQDMPGQQNHIDPFTKVRIPEGYCFSVHNPPGKETLFVIFSRDKKDFFELYESVKSKQEKGESAVNTIQMSDAKRMDAAVEHLNQQFGGSRDISITRIPEPKKKDEPRGAVYVVNISDKPSSNLVTKIEVTHK